MALTKEVVEDKIEIVGDFKTVQIRTATVIKEDGVELSRTFSRHMIIAGQDYSDQSDQVKKICDAVHTTEIIAAQAAFTQANDTAPFG